MSHNYFFILSNRITYRNSLPEKKNQCKIVLKLNVMECQASFYKMILISKLILFVSDYMIFWAQGFLKCLNKNYWRKEKKRMTWLCVNQTKHVIYSRLELKMYLTYKSYKNSVHFLWFVRKCLNHLKLQTFCRYEDLFQSRLPYLTLTTIKDEMTKYWNHFNDKCEIYLLFTFSSGKKI